jgi:hypothetical protein
VILPLSWFPANAVVKDSFPMKTQERRQLFMHAEIHLCEDQRGAFLAPPAGLTTAPRWAPLGPPPYAAPAYAPPAHYIAGPPSASSIRSPGSGSGRPSSPPEAHPRSALRRRLRAPSSPLPWREVRSRRTIALSCRRSRRELSRCKHLNKSAGLRFLSGKLRC